MLHTVNKSPFTNNTLESCLDFARQDDLVLLYEDGVLAAQAGSKVEKALKDAMKKHPVYALEEDLNARGIKNIVDGVKIINYSGFVDLVDQHIPTPWL